eukprot:TRINITY_DN17284_c0_g1_i1.p2 TRINITY_DN17284_c0_g1~~TRINITY_DN17284_c0_g1_i1.p2  ORF type:complete len:224 (-),score=46.47 TRINITY_DN17284_c0_g1_i1:390-1061(-)
MIPLEYRGPLWSRHEVAFQCHHVDYGSADERAHVGEVDLEGASLGGGRTWAVFGRVKELIVFGKALQERHQVEGDHCDCRERGLGEGEGARPTFGEDEKVGDHGDDDEGLEDEGATRSAAPEAQGEEDSGELGDDGGGDEGEEDGGPAGGNPHLARGDDAREEASVASKEHEDIGSGGDGVDVDNVVLGDELLLDLGHRGEEVAAHALLGGLLGGNSHNSSRA